MNNKIMISYAHLDYEQYVKPIEEAFRRAQINFWIDKTNIEPSHKWDLRINQGINQCSIFLAIVTPNYRKSLYCFYEAQVAAKLYQSDQDNRVIYAIYMHERRNEKLDNLFGSSQSHFFDSKNFNEEIINLLDQPAIKKCSLFTNIEEINQSVYDYQGDLLGQIGFDFDIKNKIVYFYKLLKIYYKKIFDNKNIIISSVNDFILYKHKINNNDYEIGISSHIKESKDSLKDLDVINSTKYLIKEMFNNNETDNLHFHINNILEKEYISHNDILNDFKNIYDLVLYLSNDQNYVVNQLIINYALNYFLEKEKLDNEKINQLLLSPVQINNKTFVNNPIYNLINDESIKNVYLYGELGIGKTSSLLNLVDQLKRDFSVLYLPLELLRRDNATIKHNIIENNTEGYNISFTKLNDYAKANQVYLIIDGVNEANELAKKDLVEEINSFANDFTIIVSSRTKNVVLNHAILNNEEFVNFTYGKYQLLTDYQVMNSLALHQIDYKISVNNKSLFMMLKNNMRLKIFIELYKNNKDSLFINQITTPGELLHSYFFDETSNSIKTKLHQDHFRNNGWKISDNNQIDILFDRIAEYTINSISLKEILTDENNGKLLSSLYILEENNNDLIFTRNEYRHFFKALYLKKIFLSLFNKYDSLKLAELASYLLKPTITYQTLYYTANLIGIHRGEKYLFENLFKNISEDLNHHIKYDKHAFINKLYTLVALGLNNSFDSFNTHNLIKEIPSFMFDNCHILSAIKIPEGVISIGKSSFYRCENITEIIIPSTLNEIISWAIVHCPNLKSLNITSNVTALGSPFFINCEKLSQITVDRSNKHFYHSEDKHLLITKKGNKVIYATSFATEINIPHNVAVIDKWAFKDAKFLKELYIPAKVGEIATDAFDNCYSLQRFIVDEKNKVFESVNNLLIKKERKQTILHRVPAGMEGLLVIPDGITKIGDDSISTAKYIEKIIVPETVTMIGHYSFADLTSLVNITFESLSKIKQFDNYIFLNCNPNLTIKDELFEREFSIIEFERNYTLQSEEPNNVYNGNFVFNWKTIIPKKVNYEIINHVTRSPITSLSIQRGNNNLINSNSSPNLSKILVFGLTEYEQLAIQPFDIRQEIISNWIIKNNVCAILITRDLPIYEDLTTLTNKYNCDLLSFSNISTTNLTNLLNEYFMK